MCQRYYYRNKSGVGYYGTASIYATNQALVFVKFPVTMRSNPTALEQSGTAGDYAVIISGTSVTCDSVPTFSNATSETSVVNFLKTSGFTVGQAGQGYALNTNAYLGWSAEL
jgi:hypothetical protein